MAKKGQFLARQENPQHALSGDCKNGAGIFRYSANSQYNGQFRNGYPYGMGVMVYADGAVYEGIFFYGIKSGEKGTITYVNGDKYIGQWSDDFSNGKGEYWFKSGERFEGSFVYGEFEGQGTMHYTNGAYYSGGWKKSKKHGEGTFYHANGSQQSGSWLKGKLIRPDAVTPTRQDTPAVTNNYNPSYARSNTARPDVAGMRNCGSVFCRNGHGYYDYPDSSRWVGTFNNGYPSGRGVCYYNNGDLYEGEWAKNAPCGEGVVYFASGRMYSAVWVNGSPIEELDADNTIPGEPVRADYNREVKTWAVVVGVGKYMSVPALKFADDDAISFYSHLKSAEGNALPDEQITMLLDDKATRDEILKTMQNTFAKADENDVILFYFSGHGMKGCFLPVDFDKSGNKLYHQEIRQVFKQSKAKHKLCIADACHSGALDYSGALTSNGPARVSLQHIYEAFEDKEGSIALLMSSKPEELSMEDQGLHQGVFTYYLLRGMEGAADYNGDYIVSIRELYVYVYRKVREYTAGIQTPVLTGDYYDALPIAYYRH
ncbi:MAG TPA: caspase family protein [Saprospiraceae bacterium]|nr:caspase family protein [Saprospiraceae bacterium]